MVLNFFQSTLKRHWKSTENGFWKCVGTLCNYSNHFHRSSTCLTVRSRSLAPDAIFALRKSGSKCHIVLAHSFCSPASTVNFQCNVFVSFARARIACWMRFSFLQQCFFCTVLFLYGTLCLQRLMDEENKMQCLMSTAARHQYYWIMTPKPTCQLASDLLMLWFFAQTAAAMEHRAFGALFANVPVCLGANLFKYLLAISRFTDGTQYRLGMKRGDIRLAFLTQSTWCNLRACVANFSTWFEPRFLKLRGVQRKKPPFHC